MRILLYMVVAILVSVLAVGGAASKDRFVAPLANSTPVYADNHGSRDSVLAFTVGTGDRLMVLGEKKDVMKVSDLKGNIGWINKAMVKQVAPNEALSFGDQKILAYLDNPEPVYILDANGAPESSISLERSFSQELTENVDRMTIERIIGENLPK